jgi:site-specific recombinase XerD
VSPRKSPTRVHRPVSPQFDQFVTSWRLHLEYEVEVGEKSVHTVDVYLRSVNQLGQFLTEHGMPTELSSITREHVQEFIRDLRSRTSGATANTRFRALQRFFAWAIEEGEIRESPMERLTPPRVDTERTQSLTEDDVRALLKTCRGTDFTARRDTAIIRLMFDTGMRRGEVAGLTIDDVDLDSRVLRVEGKGRRVRYQPFGRAVARDLDRYLRSRVQHPDNQLPNLWLGRAGPMTPSGVYQVIRDRGIEAGLGKIHPHQLRHAFSNAMKARGASEEDTMRLGGWKSPEMVRRYGESLADDRARQTHDRLSPGDRV